MSLLAHHSVKVKNEYTTSTDEIFNQNRIFNRNYTISNDYYLNLILNEVPSPFPFTSIEDIVEFKEGRHRDLLGFRNYIYDWTERIKNSTSNLDRFRNEFELYKLEIKELMEDSGITTIGSTLEIVLPPLSGVAAQYYFNNLDSSDIVSVIASTSTAIAISKITSKVTQIQRNNTPLSYLYHAKNEKII